MMLDEKCKSNLSSQSANNFFFNSGKNSQKHYFWYTLDQHLWSKIGLMMCFWLMMVRLCWVEWVVGLDHHVHQAAKWQSQGHRQFKLHAHFLSPLPPPRPPHLINMAMDTKRAIIIQWPWLEIREILCKKLLKKIWQAGNERSGWPSGP